MCEREILCDEAGGHCDGDGPFPGRRWMEPRVALEARRIAVVLGVEAAFL